ncbi:uncharacterized protein LOC114403034 [Glycine soja]|uniref:uncharacterized protein LOC114403034 n=1 Tax=Glycine soja TaxID=3848 RepID=UPI00103D5B2E|nr:uncharacterized protein LOC114403034 [Glycine soja]
MSYGGAVPFAESKRGLVKFPFIALAAVQPRTVHRQSSGIENSSNPPKLRRNASTSCDTISTSQYGPSDPVSLQNKVNLTPIYAAIPSFQIAATMVNIWHIPKKA